MIKKRPRASEDLPAIPSLPSLPLPLSLFLPEQVVMGKYGIAGYIEGRPTKRPICSTTAADISESNYLLTRSPLLLVSATAASVDCCSSRCCLSFNSAPDEAAAAAAAAAAAER